MIGNNYWSGSLAITNDWLMISQRIIRFIMRLFGSGFHNRGIAGHHDTAQVAFMGMQWDIQRFIHL